MRISVRKVSQAPVFEERAVAMFDVKVSMFWGISVFGLPSLPLSFPPFGPLPEDPLEPLGLVPFDVLF